MIGDELEAIRFATCNPGCSGASSWAVYAAHKVAAEECTANFRKAPRPTTSSATHRRAKLEGFMRDAADMEGVPHQVVRSRMSAWNHTELRSGPVILTASSVQSPCDLVEEADFRLTLARDNQAALWPEPGDEPPDDAPLYVILLHSKSRWPREDQVRYGHLPGSAYLGFPLPDLSGYAHEINLFERFSEVMDSLLPQEWDQEAKVQYLRSARKIAIP